MLDPIFIIWIIWAILLVIWSALPEENVKPIKSKKDWLFSIWTLIMLVYAVANLLYWDWSIFFIILEIFAIITCILMLIDIDDKIDTIFITISGLILISWSIFISQDFNTVYFILWLTGIWLGFAFKTGSLRRDIWLTIWSVLIAVFSYLVGSWIFFWLNVFFALFSGYYFIKNLKSKHYLDKNPK